MTTDNSFYLKLKFLHIFDPPALTECTAEINYAMSQNKDVILDFDNVQFIGSPFIGVLMMAAGIAKKNNVNITIKNACHYVFDILNQTAVAKVITVEPKA